MAAPKIDVKQAHHDVEASDALLICAYESREKFRSNHLQGAISLQEFHSRERSIPKQRELVFYCA